MKHIIIIGIVLLTLVGCTSTTSIEVDIIESIGGNETIEGGAGNGELIVATFADPGLEAAIKEAVNKDILSLDDVSALDTLFAYGRGIGDLTGIDQCVNIVCLYMWQNELMDISPLRSLNLSILNLWGNHISDINFLSGMDNLMALDLEGNEISDISVLGTLTHLRHISLKSNLITEVPDFSLLTDLQTLDLRGNQITDTSFLRTLPETVEVQL